MKEEMIRKLCSRKFWALVGGFVTGIVVAINTQDATQVAGIVMSLGSIVAYILGESWTDASNAASNQTVVTATTSAAKTVEKIAGVSDAS